MQTHKNTIIGVALAGVVLLLSVVTYAYSRPQQAPAPAPQASTQKAPKQTPTTISYTAEKGKTALAQLKEVANVETKTSEYGPYVDTVNGAKGGTNGKYWTFYIDSKLAGVGANEYKAKGGEKIEWKFEKLQ